MGIGLSGMVSGLDTDSIVKAMVSGQQAKATKIENKITLNKWTSDAWSSLNKKVYSFYTKYASKLRLQTSYMTRTAKSSNESVVTATAGSSAAVGTHALQIKKLASSQYVTGAQLKTDGKKANYNKSSKLTEMGTGVKAGTIITITGNKDTDAEKVTKLEVTDKTTVNDFINACKESGLTASFDATQQRFFISSSQSGVDDAFSITTSKLSENASNVFNGLNNIINTSSLSAAEKKTYEEAMATLRQNVGLIDDVLGTSYDESDKTQKAVYDAVNVVKDTAEKAYANEEAVKAETQKIKAALTAAAGTTTAIAYGSTKLTYTELEDKAIKAIDSRAVSEGDAAGAKAVKELKVPAEGVTGNYAKVTDLTQKKYDDAAALIADKNIAEADIATSSLTDAEKKALTDAYAVVNTWNYEVTKEDGSTAKVGELYSAAYTAASDAVKATTVEDEMIAQLKADQKTVYDEAVSKASKAILDAEDTTEITQLKNDITTSLTSAGTAGTEASNGGLSALGLGEIDGSAVSDGGANGMAVVAAANAEFVLDGATMEETSNNFTVNGITLNLSATTESKDTPGTYDSVQITVGKDGDSTYDLIKEALTEYNKLIEEMNTLYDADSARGYEPLTDEQKEAMTEDDIKNWEDKIKGSLLRRDNTLGSLLSSMRTALSSTYKDEEDGKTYSLSSFGIVTGNYTENGKLHIYGDEDDPTYSTYTDRLKKALEEDPDQVMETLTSVFGKLYETMTEKCAKTEISSALTFYNDKQYTNLRKGYEDDLDTLEERIKELEDKYYKQFTAMETAMSKLQSQQSSLAQMLGQTIQ